MGLNMQARKQRRLARKVSLQVLYCSEVANISVNDILSGEVAIPEIDEIDTYAVELIEGTNSKIDELDKILDDVSENWSIERMPIVDKCLLRQTVYEMLYKEDIPVSVSINEAVELAKQFCAEDDSHKYVNGVLGKIARQNEKE